MSRPCPSLSPICCIFWSVDDDKIWLNHLPLCSSHCIEVDCYSNSCLIRAPAFSQMKISDWIHKMKISKYSNLNADWILVYTWMYIYIACTWVYIRGTSIICMSVYVTSSSIWVEWGNDTSGREAQEVNSEWQLVNASQHQCNPSVLNIFPFKTCTNVNINTSNTSYLLLLVE